MPLIFGIVARVDKDEDGKDKLKKQIVVVVKINFKHFLLSM